MTLQFSVGNGQAEGELGVNDIVQQLSKNGEQVLGVSADGSVIKMQDANGPFDARTEDVLKDLGWQVNSVMPVTPNYSSVNQQWRQAISMLPADDHKRAYLEGQFKKAGMEGVNIVGTGRDWFAFDPQSNQYVALTNSPEWEMADAREGLAAAPRVVGSVVGGGAGALLGGGANPLTGALGAGLGGALGDSFARVAGASSDPILRDIMQGDLGAMAKDVGTNAAFDAVTQGAFLGIPKLAGALAPELGQSVKSFLQTGPLSTAAKSVGSMAEEGGRLVNKAAGVVDRSPFLREIAAASNPVTDVITTAGLTGQLPGQAVRGAARGIGAIGNSQAARAVAPEGAERLLQASKRLLRPSNLASNTGNEVTKSAQRVGRQLAGDLPATGRKAATSEDILGNFGEMVGMSRAERVGAEDILKRDYLMARQYGIAPKDAKLIAEEARERAIPERAKTWREYGRKAGRYVQNLEDFGSGLQRLGSNITSGGLKALRGGSYVGGKAGAALKNTGIVTQPIENKLYARFGAEELYDPEILPSDSWQERRNRARLGTILADQ